MSRTECQSHIITVNEREKENIELYRKLNKEEKEEIDYQLRLKIIKENKKETYEINEMLNKLSENEYIMKETLEEYMKTINKNQRNNIEILRKDNT